MRGKAAFVDNQVWFDLSLAMQRHAHNAVGIKYNRRLEGSVCSGRHDLGTVDHANPKVCCFMDNSRSTLNLPM